MKAACIRLSLVALIAIAPAASPGAEDLNVMPHVARDVPAERMMQHYLSARIDEALDARQIRYEALKSAEQIEPYQVRKRSFFLERIGELPERTPLNPQVVGTLEADGYRIEKIIFESRPGMYVTATLYIPDGDPPFPGVLVPCGHSATGKAYESYQRIAILLARNGMVSLCFDPICQGERYAILDSDGKGQIGGTVGHTHVGVGCILLGTNVANYFIWDGIRAMDYLAGRPEVDPGRLGCTGNSGGGTQTSYLMALDDRIVAAAPSCYLTTLRALLPELGPQDAEQNIFGAVAEGMEHTDYIIMRAPRPTLMLAATRDYFDITGTWDTCRQAKRIYTRLGFPERVDLVETDEEHGFSYRLRVGSVRWMRRWLMGMDDAVTESDFPVHTEKELQCTERGQSMLLNGARSPFDFNAELGARLARERRLRWDNQSPQDRLQSVRDVTGIRPIAEIPDLKAQRVGELKRDGYAIGKLALESDAGIILPALLFEPEQRTGQAYLHVDGAGKASSAAPGGAVERLVHEGHTVLSVDLRGIGETEPQNRHKSMVTYFGSDWQDFFRAYLLGTSYVAMRTEDVLACARFLAEQSRAERDGVHLWAVGQATVPALHAAALEPSLFAALRLERGISSWAEVVRTPVSRHQLINTVHGALRVYDLPDLVASLPAGRVSMTDGVTPSGDPLRTDR